MVEQLKKLGVAKSSAIYRPTYKWSNIKFEEEESSLKKATR